MIGFRFSMAVMIATLGPLTGCTQGKPPFRMVQFCLEDTDGIPAFTDFMRNLAMEHRMRFYDRSSDTHQELRALAADVEGVPLNSRTVNIGAQRDEEIRFAAGNLRMPTNQIVIAFNGNDMIAARAFADSVVAKLSRRWTIKDGRRGTRSVPTDGLRVMRWTNARSQPSVG